MFKEKNKQEIDDTFDIQHIFMKNFLQHLKKEEKFGLKFSNVLFRKKKIWDQASLKSICAIDYILKQEMKLFIYTLYIHKDDEKYLCVSSRVAYE